MHHLKLFHVEIFRKKSFWWMLSQIFVFGDNKSSRGDNIAGAWRCSVMHRRSVSGAQGCSAPTPSHERS